ncbi:MAG TPA: MmgE/PrpD family protein [Noviherbaspirillum sp.]|nr:MmgE/PrpD family protein [Noviherbaspirillum sp.]
MNQPVQAAKASALAEFIYNSPSLSRTTVERAKKVIVDTIAANLAGLSSEVYEPLLKYAAASNAEGDYAVLGSARRVDAETAALINGTLSAALEFDDVLSMMPGHPSAVVVPALCASKAALAANGMHVVEAYVVGIEVGARIAQAITLDHYKKGFHATGTICLFSAVAALAKIEKLTPEQTDVAFGIAASMSSGIQGNFGTMTKPLHSGWAARNAVCAVQLCLSGLTASRNIFETEGGFFDAYGTEESGLSHIDGLLGKEWIVDKPGIALKLFPCCYATHRGIDAVLSLKAELGIEPADVERVICKVPPGGLIPLKFAKPRTRFESLFSMPYALCMAILHDRPRLKSFTEECVHAPEVAHLLQRIDVSEDPSCVADYPDYEQKSYGSRGEVTVEIVLRDGRRAGKTVRIAPGHPDRELTWEQSEQKFQDCASAAGFSDKRIRETYADLKTLDDQLSFGAVIAALNL